MSDNPFRSGGDYMPQETRGPARPKSRETAWRVFSSELNATKLEIRAAEEKMPSYVVTPLGAKINRILIAGTLTEKEDRGTEEEHMWICRIEDTSGHFFVNAGRFQPEASAALSSMTVPCYAAAVGKVRMYTNTDGSTGISVRPERIIEIDESTYLDWVLDTAVSTWDRLRNMKRACSSPDTDAEALIRAGVNPAEAEGIIYAIDNDDPPDSGVYLRSIQNALRRLLPGEDVDFGFPDSAGSEPSGPPAGSQESSAEKEDIILRLLEELDSGGRGAPRDELERRAESMGISSIDLEEISNSLMDKGLVYEPNLRYLKRI